LGKFCNFAVSCNGRCWSFSSHLAYFCGRFVYAFNGYLVYFYRFGMLYLEKSGNPAPQHLSMSARHKENVAF
jgi:hypothetical protein